jgi:ribosomal protein S18 acetylase RimI-like enzyme
MDGENPLRCLVAVDESDRPRGFTIFVALPFTWSRKEVCYLEDIYVDPDARGKGYASAMIAELVEIGRREGWFKIFWMTESDNVRAQRFYERVARKMDYLRYDLNIDDAGV